MIRLVLLDVDDTLLPSTTTFWGAVQEVLDARYPDEPLLASLVLRLVYYFGTTEYRGFWLALCAERGLNGPARLAEHEALCAAYKAAYARRISARPGAAEFLAALRARGRIVGIVSNGRAAFQRMKLMRTGLLPFVDGPLLVSGDFPPSHEKPTARMFEEALARTAVAAHEALFVGDRTEDVIGGNLAGLWTVRFEAPEQPPAPPGLRVAQPHASAPDIAALLGIVEHLEARSAELPPG